jgi:hypothetical protein
MAEPLLDGSAASSNDSRSWSSRTTPLQHRRVAEPAPRPIKPFPKIGLTCEWRVATNSFPQPSQELSFSIISHNHDDGAQGSAVTDYVGSDGYPPV